MIFIAIYLKIYQSVLCANTPIYKFSWEDGSCAICIRRETEYFSSRWLSRINNQPLNSFILSPLYVAEQSVAAALRCLAASTGFLFSSAFTPPRLRIFVPRRVATAASAFCIHMLLLRPISPSSFRQIACATDGGGGGGFDRHSQQFFARRLLLLRPERTWTRPAASFSRVFAADERFGRNPL